MFFKIHGGDDSLDDENQKGPSKVLRRHCEDETNNLEAEFGFISRKEKVNGENDGTEWN